MPYVRCPECQVSVYSAARYSGRDGCPLCGAVLVLAPPRRSSSPPAFALAPSPAGGRARSSLFALASAREA